ncbi:chemotaxis protein CheA [Ramlibacter tataouinensis]|uniref:chemotaxis protein CheA n=1 Tax=Ramlibacter tataouinensis TaxID=94132 RepID=UPI0022F4022A|nr:chemotaxis protein CheA [Ramlibacter tataouinensis]WBY02461.1 chemotaxis protein CheA [Ramlibacter tataouinensis]
MNQPSTAFGDANAYREIFFEETHEHLAQVESILLRLQPEQADGDWQADLNAIFRAVHSIKGSAAMLGCHDMAALAHLQENLLDVLRKQERALEAADVQALLRAGDAVQAQALCHRGLSDKAPETLVVEALLRDQLARPRAGAQGDLPGPVRRAFRVQLGPLAEAIADAELEMMLAGLAEMGTVGETQIDNVAGGSVAFDVELEGTAMDLQSVLALLVAPELVAIEPRQPAGTPALAAEAQAASPAPVAGADLGDELFVDPDEFRRKRAAAAPAESERPEPAVAPAPQPATAPQPAATAQPAAADLHEPVGLAATDTGYIRVATEKIDLLVNLVGELVITEAMLARSSNLAGEGGDGRFSEGGLADLSRHTRNLQEAVLAIRMLPISNVFSRFPRLVHELGSRLGKRVELRFGGESTELDRGLIEKISDPLTHLVRNAVDHGLETPDERAEAGKPPVGTLRLHATQRGGNVVIEVSDDGRGLDRRRILAQAARRGIPVPADASDAQVWQLVFMPGFSTAEQVTELSGRGVGMDVVRRNIQALGGTVELSSAAGWGTTVTVSVPLTLAIIEAMTVAIGNAIYVLPLSAVAESLRVQPGEIHSLPGHGDMLRVREDYLPVLHLARLFPPQQPAEAADTIAVIVEAEGQRVALVVDELVGQQQIVVKSLEANFRRVPGLSGATVMGDGSVALILDVSHLVRRCSGRQASHA